MARLKGLLIYLWNFWPPFFGAGVRIHSISSDYREIQVRLLKRPWTANYIGIQFGGSIFSMVDPIYMLMLIRNLGDEYFVVDKAGQVQFLKPGKTELHATCTITDADLIEIRERVQREGKIDWEREIEIKNLDDVTVAVVRRTVYIALRRKAN